MSFAAAVYACNSGTENKPATDTTAAKTDTAAPQPTLNIDTMPYPGNVGKSVFLIDGKTIFYYDVDAKKGHITINGTKYDFDVYQHQINEPDFLLKSGDKVVINVTGAQYFDQEEPEPGILKGKAARVSIKLGSDSLVLENKVQVHDGINAD